MRPIMASTDHTTKTKRRRFSEGSRGRQELIIYFCSPAREGVVATVAILAGPVGTAASDPSLINITR